MRTSPRATEARSHGGSSSPRRRCIGAVSGACGVRNEAYKESPCLRVPVARWTVGIVVLVLAWLTPLSGQQLLDRIVASIGRQPILLSDVRIAIGLALVAPAAGDDP